MSNGVPSGAIAVSILVISYTVLCLSLAILLFYLLWTSERKLSYVLMVAGLLSISTSASLMQQVHYATSWRTIKEGTFALRKQHVQDAGAAISNGTHGLDLVLFWIEFYTYNASASLILCWCAVLFQGTWRIDMGKSHVGGIFEHFETFSKFFAMLFPAFLIGIAQIKTIRSHKIVFAILCNAALVISTTLGSILLMLTLWRFIQSRRSLNGSTFSSNQRSYGISSTTGPHPNIAKKNQRNIERSIISRFSAGFSLLSAFNVLNIIFQIHSINVASTPTTDKAPDFSTHTAVSDILQFIPGVTSALVAWAIWGTTKTFWQMTKDILHSAFCCCGCCRSGRNSSGRSRGNPQGIPARLGGDGGFTRLGSAGAIKTNIIVETQLTRETELRFMDGGEAGRSDTMEPLGDERGKDGWPRTHQVKMSRT